MIRWLKPAAALAFVASSAFVAVGWVADPREAANAYLIAYAYVFTTVMGMLMMITIGHLTYSRWFVLVRRLAEAIVGALPVLCLLFVPILLSLDFVYPWMSPETLDRQARLAVEARGDFQTTSHFVGRSIAYLLLVTASGEALIFFSRRQDRGSPGSETRRMRILSGAILPLAAVVLTFAGFDWIMSIEPGWYSDIFGVYLFGGGYLSAISWLALGATWARRAERIPKDFAEPHFHALGTLIFAFVIFWTYIAFAQYMLIWIGDLPAEAKFYIRRTLGPYEPYAIMLVIVHFAIPFTILLFRQVKRHRVSLAGVSVILVVAHYLDLHWVISPALHTAGPTLTWLDVLAMVSLLSATTLAAIARFERSPALPTNDPLFDESLSYGGVP